MLTLLFSRSAVASIYNKTNYFCLPKKKPIRFMMKTKGKKTSTSYDRPETPPKKKNINEKKSRERKRDRRRFATDGWLGFLLFFHRYFVAQCWIQRILLRKVFAESSPVKPIDFVAYWGFQTKCQQIEAYRSLPLLMTRQSRILRQKTEKFCELGDIYKFVIVSSVGEEKKSAEWEFLSFYRHFSAFWCLTEAPISLWCQLSRAILKETKNKENKRHRVSAIME